MQRRFLRSFGSIERDPFAQCSVRNCRLEVNDSLVRFSDAVMFHLHLLRSKFKVVIVLPHKCHFQRILYLEAVVPIYRCLLAKSSNNYFLTSSLQISKQPYLKRGRLINSGYSSRMSHLTIPLWLTPS